MTAADPRLVELRAGRSRLTLAPAIGGGVARFVWDGEDLLRPATPATLDSGDPLGLGNFPLAPFAGRIAGARFAFDGRSVSLPANLAGETDAIHGQGWRSPWRVVGCDLRTARLRLDHLAGDWPWAYRAEQTFSLSDVGLSHTLSVTNLDTRPMPAGLGLHPYFPRDHDTRLLANAPGVYMTADADAVSPPPSWDWGAGPALTEAVDNQFTGWSGPARITWPSRGLALTLLCRPASPFLVVYVPPGEAHFCVEPVSHRLNAVNLSSGGGGHGMTILAPGESVSLTVEFLPERLAAR